VLIGDVIGGVIDAPRRAFAAQPARAIEIERRRPRPFDEARHVEHRSAVL